MRRDQTFHERLIPLLVEGVGARSYLEFGSHDNETIGKVTCESRFAVDIKPNMTVEGVHYFPMSTQDFLARGPNGSCSIAESFGPFDFVFIDADHSAEAVAKDFSGIWPHVSDEGLVVAHDTNPETVADTDAGLCGDSWVFASLLAMKDHECVTLPYHPGLTIIRKRLRWGPK